MGLFDSLLKVAGGAASSGLLNAVVGMATNPQTGGLQGLVQKAVDSGLAEQAASWVGKEANLPITPEQVHAVFGSEMVHNLAAQLNVPHAEVANGLAAVLPEVVNHLTPEGVVPSHDSPVLQQGLAALTAFKGL